VKIKKKHKCEQVSKLMITLLKIYCQQQNAERRPIFHEVITKRSGSHTHMYAYFVKPVKFCVMEKRLHFSCWHKQRPF